MMMFFIPKIQRNLSPKVRLVPETAGHSYRVWRLGLTLLLIPQLALLSFAYLGIRARCFLEDIYIG